VSWENHNKNPQQNEIDFLGQELSAHINCAVRYPVYDKHMFECHCTNLNNEGITFPVFMIKSAVENNDWKDIVEMHKAGNQI
jgi:hypothetical protein